MIEAIVTALCSVLLIVIIILIAENQYLRGLIRPFDRDGDGKPGGSRKRS